MARTPLENAKPQTARAQARYLPTDDSYILSHENLGGPSTSSAPPPTYLTQGNGPGAAPGSRLVRGGTVLADFRERISAALSRGVFND